MPSIKGSALASRVLWVRLRYGSEGLSRLASRVSAPLRDVIDHGAKLPTWYPFELFVELTVAIDQEFGTGDLALARELGRYGADANMTTIYRLFYKVGTVQWILQRAVRLWAAHYDAGRVDLYTRGPGTADLEIVGFPTPHRAHCDAICGFVERCIELSGGQAPKVTEVACRTRGDDKCRIETTWR